MTSEKKLQEARYFLDQININFQDSAKCEYCVSAFLHACYDLFGHLLEEYQIEFKLGISVDAFMNENRFLDVASRSGNNNAKGFFELYIRECHMLARNPISASLMAMRNLNTHRDIELTPFVTFKDDDISGHEILDRYFLSDLKLLIEEYNTYVGNYVDKRIGMLNKINEKMGCNTICITEEERQSILSEGAKLLCDYDMRNVCRKYLLLLEGSVSRIRAQYRRF